MNSDFLLRDIGQLDDAHPFSFTAVDGLLSVEEMLSEALRFVPFCSEHKKVWSPRFASVILEAASQIDSVWKATTKIGIPSTATDKLTLKKHFNRFGAMVAKQEVVFFCGESPCTLSPFSVWRNAKFSDPAWWTAYNSLKHDRFANHEKATLENAVAAVAALLLAIVYSGECDIAIIAANLLGPSNANPWAFTDTGRLRDVNAEGQTKIETKVFAHPIGIFGVDKLVASSWWVTASVRFNIWWLLYYRQHRQRKK